MQALEICQRTDRSFQRVFRAQYFMSEDGGLCPEGWVTRRLKGWHLYHCPELNVAEIFAVNGRRVGWLLGIGVSPDGSLFPSGMRLAVAPGDNTFWSVVEAMIEGVAGRYAAILSDGREERIYHDPVCDLSCVFDPTTRVVASTLFLCLHRPLVRNRRMPHRGPLKGKHNYALQQTADRYVKRALPNHYLSLRTFSPVRHFPRGDEVLQADETQLDIVCERIAERLKQVTTTLLTNFDCVLPVTGGNDSRNLLACAADVLGQTKTALFTHHINKMSGFDCMIGQDIGDMLGVDVQIVDVLGQMSHGILQGQSLHARQWDTAYATGYQTKGKSSAHVAALDLAPEGDLLLRGNVMELMRANQYPQGRETPFDLKHGLAKLRPAPTIDEAAVAAWGDDYMMWVDTLPENAKAKIYDFAFIEQLLPNTMGGTLWGPFPQFYVNPFSDRGMIVAALSIPAPIRRRNRINRRIVDLTCPALNEIPRTNAFKKDPDNHASYERLFTRTR
jgi:hypothetical protein